MEIWHWIVLGLLAVNVGFVVCRLLAGRDAREVPPWLQ